MKHALMSRAFPFVYLPPQFPPLVLSSNSLFTILAVFLLLKVKFFESKYNKKKGKTEKNA